MEQKTVDVHICYRDRPSELGLLLQSLRTQTYRRFRILISDDCSGTRIENYYFLVYLMNRLRIEGIPVFVSVCPFPHGVSRNRQRLVDWSLRDNMAEYICRVDDDVVLCPTYLEKLVEVIEKHNYDLATGTTPFIGGPHIKRDPKFLNGVANRTILNNGSFLYNGDDQGLEYTDEVIIPCDHFRSCALYKLSIHSDFPKVNYNSRLSKHGFREENLLSWKFILAGLKLGCITKNAEALHFQCPSGGERFADQNELIHLNQQIFEEETKELYREHGDFIKKYHEKLGVPEWIPTNEELMKETNLARLR